MNKTCYRIAAVGAAVTLLTGSGAGAAESLLPDLSAYPAAVVVDGARLDEGKAPYFDGGQVRIPLRTVLESADFSVEWDGARQQVRAVAPDGTAYQLDLTDGTLRQDGTVCAADTGLTLRDGTTYVSPALLEALDGLAFQWDPATNAALVTTDTPDGRLYCYDLGQGALQNPSRPDTAYQMQGVLGVPDGENRPVVVLLHGAHPLDKAAENRYDLGFAYLADALAEAGYLAVSMNVGINFSFEDGEPMGCERTVQVVQQQMDALTRAIAGEQGAFPCDLTGKGDLSQLVLLGHSRSGRDVFELAQRLPELGVDGILSVAPAFISPLETLPDVPAGIVIPQLDGDVSSLDGAQIYDLLENAPGRTAPEELIYLKNGNHGGFSTALVRPDPFADAESIAQTLPAAAQQAFLTDYTLQFLDAALDGSETVFSQTGDLPDRFADCDVLIQTDRAGKSLYSAAQGGTVQPQHATAEPVNASSTVSNTAGAFHLPGSFLDYALLRVQWDEAQAALHLPVSADLRQYDFLQLDLAQDSTDARNGKRDQALTVTVQDASGGQASISLPAGTPALQWQPGEIEYFPLGEGEEFAVYSTFTPLGTVRIDLHALDGVDLSAVRQVSLAFPGESGSIMLREVRAV